MARLQVKICGLSTPETVAAAVAGGAAYVGFVFFPPSPRCVPAARAAELAPTDAADLAARADALGRAFIDGTPTKCG